MLISTDELKSIRAKLQDHASKLRSGVLDSGIYMELGSIKARVEDLERSVEQRDKLIEQLGEMIGYRLEKNPSANQTQVWVRLDD